MGSGHSAVLTTLRKALEILPPPGLPAARGQHLVSVKLNVVVMGGVNNSEAMDFLEIARRERICVRFVDSMRGMSCSDVG